MELTLFGAGLVLALLLVILAIRVYNAIERREIEHARKHRLRDISTSAFPQGYEHL